jgi:hypothetical protein
MPSKVIIKLEIKKMKNLNAKLITIATFIALLLASAACNSSSSSGDNLPLGIQFDRAGIAGVNTVFIPSGSKDAFNAGDPTLDPADFGASVVATVNALRAALAAVPGFPAEDLGIAAEAVRDIVIPDVVSLDLSAPDGFPNGRRLEDDVIDVALQVTLNRSIVGDGIANDSAFLTNFPYLGNPN